ncbi:MAG: SpoIID/LytB domain-containing protein [Bacteroidales bacterium]|nr:SpoIID/LytB domain-containing protein [Bacteroidales bacterium]
MIIDENRDIVILGEGDIAFLQLRDNKLSLSTSTQNYGEYSSLVFRDRYYKGRFMLRSVTPSSKQRLCKGDLSVSILHGTLSLVNEFDFDHYLAGVVEAEAGPGAPEEFFKVQSVLCRTYAIRNWERHLEEGFNLCDDTHCQVFHGIADDNPSILNAVLATHGTILADRNYNLISAAYHSNSGGETQKADDLWPGTHDYLLPIIDPYSGDQPAFRWTKTLDMDTWKNYLISQGIPVSEHKEDDLLIRQDHRKIYFVIGKDTVRIQDVREDFSLRSSFFSMKRNGNEIILEGKGYGHGIGLSQEGAMEMARQGYSYRDILQYYYHEIQVLDIKELPIANVPAVFR